MAQTRLDWDPIMWSLVGGMFKGTAGVKTGGRETAVGVIAQLIVVNRQNRQNSCWCHRQGPLPSSVLYELVITKEKHHHHQMLQSLPPPSPNAAIVFAIPTETKIRIWI